MKDNHWSIHVEWLALMITLIGSVYFLDSRFESKVQRVEERLDIRIDAQAERTDRLYEMFIDLIKEQRK